MSFFFKISNLAAFITMLGLNFKFGAPKSGNKEDGPSIRRLSETYDHVAMPKGPAFAIWGFIFMWTLVFTVTQACTSMFDDILSAFTPWFCAAQLMQGFWVPLFTSSDPKKRVDRGDAWLWVSNALLMGPIPFAFLQACEVLARVTPGSAAYWISYGVTINAAWVLLAAGLTVNLSAIALGLRGALLASVAVLVLAGTIVLELYITGLIGSSPFNSPTAFFSVGVWALFWVFLNLKDVSMDKLQSESLLNGAESEVGSSDHAKRIIPLYGSAFVVFYKWSALLVLILFVGLEALVCTHE